MIYLSQDCLVFELSSGESIPFSAEMISVELLGDALSRLDPEIIRNAAAAVFHYFKYELDRESVTVGEFAQMLEKVLRGLGLNVQPADTSKSPKPDAAADLVALACESGAARELVFFPKLRRELRAQLRSSPKLVRFQGLRRCVKHLAGARRWCPRCESLQDQIVDYLRVCLSTDPHEIECRLVVE